MTKSSNQIYPYIGLVIVTLLTLSSCATYKGTINSYIDPSYVQGGIKRIAVFSIRNSSRAPSEARDINSKLIKAIVAKNPGIEIVSPTEALRKINDAGIADKWARFVEDYYSSGIANKQYLTEISKALNVDALVQGQLVNVHQQDGDQWALKGNTRITVSYSIVEISTAKQIWEASADGIRVNARASSEAPPIVEAILLAIDKIIENIPYL